MEKVPKIKVTKVYSEKSSQEIKNEPDIYSYDLTSKLLLSKVTFGLRRKQK